MKNRIKVLTVVLLLLICLLTGCSGSGKYLSELTTNDYHTAIKVAGENSLFPPTTKATEFKLYADGMNSNLYEYRNFKKDFLANLVFTDTYSEVKINVEYDFSCAAMEYTDKDKIVMCGDIKTAYTEKEYSYYINEENTVYDRTEISYTIIVSATQYTVVSTVVKDKAQVESVKANVQEYISNFKKGTDILAS